MNICDFVPVVKMLLPRLVPFLVSVLWCQCWAITIDTRLGQITGLEQKTVDSGRTYYSFYGIPYAKPPVGQLRLKNPVPDGGWSGTLDATLTTKPCIQSMIFIKALRNTTVGTEDCLYLNIHLPTADVKKKLPVLVYIHGGAFRCGTPGPPGSANRFMEEDVVLVTVEYRVGALGFLSTEDSRIPGNFGLKDQALALKWVSENIDQYGGDPKSITIFGESAGGASVHFLITSPLSRGLVKGAIAQSGVKDAGWALALPGKARLLAQRLADTVGCEMDESFLECLQGIGAVELSRVELNFAIWDIDPGVLFNPVIEVPNERAFLTEDPRKIKVTTPLITGHVPGEGLIKTSSLVNQNDSVTDYFVENFDNLLPQLIGLDPRAPKISDVVNLIRGRYFKDLNDRQAVLLGLEAFYSETLFFYPMMKTLKSHVGTKYAYIFRHRAKHSLADLNGPKRASLDKPGHADELLSLFDWSSVFQDNDVPEEDKKVYKKLIKYWTNFGKYQNPTPEGSDVTWDQYTENNMFSISTKEDKMENIDYSDVVKFWDNIVQIIISAQFMKEEL